jgi:hypothetical protein
VLNVVVLALVTEVRRRPEAADHFDRLAKTRLTLAAVDSITGVFIRALPRRKPMSRRPPLIRSSIAVSSARRIGLCSGGTRTAMPIRILLVLAAMLLARTVDDEAIP